MMMEAAIIGLFFLAIGFILYRDESDRDIRMIQFTVTLILFFVILIAIKIGAY
jgi:uncharacterized membrane protein YcaP (DUF421 family)